jgi:hypothetical protein
LLSISGTDMNYIGGAAPGAPVPGISTMTDANTQETITSLNKNQQHDVTGLGYSAGPPTVPSVMTSTSGLTAAQITQFVRSHRPWRRAPEPRPEQHQQQQPPARLVPRLERRAALYADSAGHLQALQFATTTAAGVSIPAPLQLVGMVDCAQVPAGTSSCP